MHDLSYIAFAGVDVLERASQPSQSGWTFPRQNIRSASASLQPRIGPDKVPIQLNPFLEWLLLRVGVDAKAYRPEAIHRRIPACLRALRVSSTEGARTLLERQPALLPRAANAVLIGVSEFFRDQNVFDFVGSKALPELLEQKKSLRVLSAGCSDGQELFSMAILLKELNALENCFLLGIDCRPSAIVGAQSGWFNAAEVNRMSAERRANFQIDGPRARVSPLLRNRVEWRIADLMTFAENGEWDIILYRNVGIYLEAVQTVRTWERLEDMLATDGLLITGKAERPPTSRCLRRLAPCVYKKCGNTNP